MSMPFKVDVLGYVDELDSAVTTIGSANTIVNDGGYLKAYNTDYIGVMEYLKEQNISHLYILGNGGFGKAVQYACRLLQINHTIVTRGSWSIIDNIIIDGRPFTNTGKQISLEQAKIQFKIYTGIDYE